MKVYVLVRVGDHTSDHIEGVYATVAAAMNAAPLQSWKVAASTSSRMWNNVIRPYTYEDPRPEEYEILEFEVQG